MELLERDVEVEEVVTAEVWDVVVEDIVDDRSRTTDAAAATMIITITTITTTNLAIANLFFIFENDLDLSRSALKI